MPLIRTCTDRLFNPDKFEECRSSEIEAILHVPYARLNEFDSLDETTTARCKKGDLNCDAIIYGSLTLGLKKCGLWPQKLGQEVSLSVEELATKIENIPISAYSAPYNRSGPHNCSGRDLRAEVDRVLRVDPQPVLESHRIHMKRQREKLSPLT
jgi:hypothetical protein